jgi:hypothetical protein
VVTPSSTSGVGLRGGVVAVPLDQHVAVAHLAAVDLGGRGVAPSVAVAVRVPRAAPVLVDRPVAVVVERVARLGGTRVHAGPGVVAVRGGVDATCDRLARLDRVRRVPEPVLVGVGVPGAAHALVHLAVAVLVAPVAQLDRAGLHPRICVVAVPLLDGEAVVVGVRGHTRRGVVGSRVLGRGARAGEEEGEEQHVVT